jgi:hypothetical protein
VTKHHRLIDDMGSPFQTEDGLSHLKVGRFAGARSVNALPLAIARNQLIV